MLHDLAFGVEEVRGALHLVFDTIFSYLFLDSCFCCWHREEALWNIE